MIGAKIVQEIRNDHWAELDARFKDLGGLWVKVGYPQNGENKGALSGGRKKNENLHMEYSEILQIAAIHEFGAPNAHIPERSFIRSTFDRKHGELDAFKSGWYDRVMEGKTSAGKALASIGEKLIAFTKTTIRARIDPPLKKPSRRRSGSGKYDADTGCFVSIDPIPLLDTGQLMNSLQLKVGRGGDNEGEAQGASIITGEMS